MAILSDVLTFARVQVQTDANGITDANGLVFANEANSDFHRRLIEKNVDASQIQESSITGVVNTGIYAYPTNPASMIALKTIELNYANTSGDSYAVAQQVDISNLPGNGSFSWLRNNGDPNVPTFDDRGDKFEIFPTPKTGQNVTALIRLVGYVKPSVFTAIGNTLNYPENLDTTILGFRIAASYLYSLGGENIIKGDVFNAKYQERVNQYINTLSRGSQQPLEATSIPLTGYEF